MLNGLLTLPWWGLLIVTLAMTHFTIVSVTLYLHRHQAHRALELHPLAALVFRTWLWLTTGMTTRSWVAVHRKHHAFVETARDPHSPQVHGIRKVLWEGAELYRQEAADPATLVRYGQGTPDDWLERHVFRHDRVGVGLMLVTNLLLYGPIGLTIWAVQMAWIPFFAAGIINGTGHWRGYRNFDTSDTSTNLTPWGILIGGEELHNNHHAFASSARFSLRSWEFDIGWCYLRVLAALGLAEIRKVAPRLQADRAEPRLDRETLSAMLTSQWHVMADYAQRVVHRVHREEIRAAERGVREVLRPLRRLINRAPWRLKPREEVLLREGLSQSRALEVVYQFQQQLRTLCAPRADSQDTLLTQLQEWCRAAEATGIAALAEFSAHIRGYRLRAA